MTFALLPLVEQLKRKHTRRRLGRWIARHQGRIVDGLRFVRASGTTSAERWAAESVMSVSQVSSSHPVESVTDDETDNEPVEVLL